MDTNEGGREWIIVCLWRIRWWGKLGLAFTLDIRSSLKYPIHDNNPSSRLFSAIWRQQFRIEFQGILEIKWSIMTRRNEGNYNISKWEKRRFGFIVAILRFIARTVTLEIEYNISRDYHIYILVYFSLSFSRQILLSM